MRIERAKYAISGLKLELTFFRGIKKPHLSGCQRKMAERTGFEPATPGVTGRYSNQLNYRSATGVHVVGDDGIEPPTLCL